MGIRIVTPPTVEPITLAALRTHLGIEPYEVDSSGTGTHPHDDMIMAMLGSAREYAENFTGRSVALKTYELALDEFPADEIELPNPPAVRIASITYVDSDLATQTVDAADYSLDRYLEPAFVLPATGTAWPATAAVANAVKIQYVAGYQVPEPDSSAEDADTLPFAIRAALMAMVGHLYENRSAVSDKQAFEVPFAVDALLRPLRVRLGMA